MTSNSKLPEIDKEAFIKAREKLGLSAKDLGGMACLSTRQIEQIESGETSAFYGAKIKFTAAKKVAKILGLSDEEAFDFGKKILPKEVEPESAPVPDSTPVLEPIPVVDQVQALPEPRKEKKQKEKAAPVQAPQTQSENISDTLVTVTNTIASSSSKPAKKKNLLLWLSVLAAAAFAVINLRPLLFADKPEEVIVVKEEVIAVPPNPSSAPSDSNPVTVVQATPPVGATASATPPASAPVAASAPALVTTSEGSLVCPVEEAIISYKPEMPRKAGDMVYVQTKSKQVVCVIDASGKAQNKLIEPGTGISFYGKPPFKVLTPGLVEVEVFFQGAKVRPSNPNSKTIILEAGEVVTAPVDRTDSQFR